MYDEDDPFKELNEKLHNLRERPPGLTLPQVNAESVIGCDDELSTSNAEPPRYSDIVAEFQPSADDNDLEEKDDNEVTSDEPPLKRPSKHKLYNAIDVLRILYLWKIWLLTLDLTCQNSAESFTEIDLLHNVRHYQRTISVNNLFQLQWNFDVLC